VLQYAVEILDIEHVIICGHYGCGGVLASMNDNAPDLVDHWIRPIRKYYRRAKPSFEGLSEQEQADRLCEINVIEQVRNICHVPAVRKAWEAGQELSVHGFIYDIKDGFLHNLDVSINNEKDGEDLALHKI